MNKLIVLLVIALATISFAANEIKTRQTTGQTDLYAIVVNDANLGIWDGSTLEDVPAAWNTCDIALTEHATVIGLYTANFPAVEAGQYSVFIYKGAAPANTDTYINGWSLNWDGTREITLRVIDSNIIDANNVQKTLANTTYAKLANATDKIIVDTTAIIAAGGGSGSSGTYGVTAGQGVIAGTQNVFMTFQLRDKNTFKPLENLNKDSGGGVKMSWYRSGETAIHGGGAVVNGTVGTYVANSIVKLSDANMPGSYQVCFPDAAFAVGADKVTLYVSTLDCNEPMEVPLVSSGSLPTNPWTSEMITGKSYGTAFQEIYYRVPDNILPHE